MKIKISLIIILLFSCNNTEKVSGRYLDLDSMKIFDFNESKLNIFDLNDSIEQVYSINYNHNRIHFENKTLFSNFKFVCYDDSLILTPLQKKSVFKDEFKLKKIESKKIDINHNMFNNYWEFQISHSITDSIYYLIRIPINYKNTGYLYRKIKDYGDVSFYRNKDDFYFVNRIFISHRVYFNRFNFLKIDYPIFNDTWFYIEDLSASKLKLLDINSNKNIVFKKYDNPNIVSFDRKWHQ